MSTSTFNGGLVLNPNVPGQDPNNGNTLSIDSTGHLQLSVGGAAPGTILSAAGATLSATTAVAATTLSIDVSAYGDGLYEIEFEGTILSSGASVFFKLQANGADLPSALGNYKTFLVGGGIGSAGFVSVGDVIQGQNFVANNHVSVLGRFSWRANQRSGWASQYASHSDSADQSGDAVGTYVAANAALSTIALTSSAANGIVSGTFYVRKVA